MKKLFFLLSGALFLASCVTTTSSIMPDYVYQETVKAYSEASARNLEPIVTAVAMPLVVDIKVVGSRIEYTETEAFANITVTDAIKEYGDKFATEGIAAFKRIALAKAAKAHNVDVIVGATFEVTTTADNHFCIKVCGYPAVYSNFRNASKNDAELLRSIRSYMPASTFDPLLNTPTTTIQTDEVIVQ